MFQDEPLLNISPLDGRYKEKLESLQNYFSEMALIRFRVAVEIEWLIYLCNVVKLPNTCGIKNVDRLRDMYADFTVADAEKVKKIESKTNHDVKAVEYFIAEKLKKSPKLTSLIHFACTSEDINNIAHSIMVKDFLEDEYLPLLETLINTVESHAKAHKNIAMLSHTHGQPASPTTMGKEFLNFAARLERQKDILENIQLTGKINGAVGNYNAHIIAYPDIDWIKVSEGFIQQFGLEPNLITTQIEPHDTLAEIFDTVKRINTILIDFDRDMWTYISLGYFKQKLRKGEVGSSTMPHKVNPIDFENSEGNLGMANALLTHFSEKLPISRLQRDLSDSTVLRNMGVAFGYTSLAYISTLRGLSKIAINVPRIKEDLDFNWEVLAEAIQTIMRKNHMKNPYEKLKTLTRGKKLTQARLKSFIKKLKLPKEDEKRLLDLSPETYIGLAEKINSRTT